VSIVERRELVVLGIDPGCITAGFSIVTGGRSRAVLIDAGALSMKSTLPLSQRIGQFHKFFDAKIRDFSVTDISLETPFLGKNAQNFLKLGYMRGIVYLLQDTYQLSLHEFAPTEVKRAVTGYGGAEKEQVARLLLRLFPNLVMPQKLDVTDAIAIGLCGLWQHDSMQRMLR